MKIKICNVIMIGLIIIGALSGCGSSKNEMESTLEALEVDYTTNDDGTFTYKDNIYKYKIEVSGTEGDSQITYIILTNNTETSFKDIAYSLKTAEISTEEPEFVVLGWY